MNNNFENYINNYTSSLKPCLLTQAIKYSLSGGKRFRPRIIFAIAKGFDINEEITYPAALALELIQTYSLIHDDLPAMDNDDFRRGKPSLHVAFKEDIAILTGDQLLTDAFRVICKADYEAKTKVNIIEALSRFSGLDGMVYGQLLDITSSNDEINKEKLQIIQDYKTGGLFKISCLIPMYIASDNNFQYFVDLGEKIGKIFQNQDDLFDATKSKEDFGKSCSDVKNNKLTALSVYTVSELKELIDNQFNDLDNYLSSADFNTFYLKELLQELKNR